LARAGDDGSGGDDGDGGGGDGKGGGGDGDGEGGGCVGGDGGDGENPAATTLLRTTVGVEVSTISVPSASARFSAKAGALTWLLAESASSEGVTTTISKL